MTFSEYQKESRPLAIYPQVGENFIYPTLGLVGETGEVAEKIKKALRDDNGLVSAEKKVELQKELGDVLWYLSQLASELGLSLEEIAAGNLAKLQSRHVRGVLHGSGDNR